MVSVSIVTFHTPLSQLECCLKSLDSRCVSRIYIIDNSRSDHLHKWCSDKPKVTYLPNDNTGYGAGHNTAIRLELPLPGEYHLVMNSDVEFFPEIIKDIEQYMDSHPSTGMLQPRMLGTNGDKQYSCRRLPTPADVFIRRFFPEGWFRGIRERYLLKHLDQERTWNIPYHQGSFMFIRKKALMDTGIFDERFFMYPEDIDLTRRIHRNYLTVYWPGATIVHHHEAASYKSLRMLGIHIVNMIRYFNKWGWIHDPERDLFNNQIEGNITYTQASKPELKLPLPRQLTKIPALFFRRTSGFSRLAKRYLFITSQQRFFTSEYLPSLS